MTIGPHQKAGWLATILAVATLGGLPARAQVQAPVSEMQLETFLDSSAGGGLDSGAPTGLGNGLVIDGSAIMQTITVSAGTTLSFHYNFLTNVPSPASAGLLNALNPFAFTTQPSLVDFEDNYSNYPSGFGAAPAGSGFRYQSGLLTDTVTFTTAGTYNFGIGVADVTTDQYSSALEVTGFTLSSGSLINGSFSTGNFNGWSTIGNDSIIGSPGSYMAIISTVPEPSGLVLLTAGVAGMRIVARRRRAREKSRPAV